MAVIVDIQLARLRKMLADRKVQLVLDDQATQWLADAGYDPVYGARPLKRVIQRALQNPLSQLVLQGRVLDGDILDVTAGPGGLIIEPIHPKESAAA
jgi:ATP-dependent Clp protease ATP-binding subunit ClpB